MRTTYVFRNGQWLNKGLPEEGERKVRPEVITDEMDALKHPIDGRFYTSKGKFRDTTRAAGCIELGNDWVAPHRKRQYSKDPVSVMRNACELHETMSGKSDGEKREIREKFMKMR
jgi:hypothetical protein